VVKGDDDRDYLEWKKTAGGHPMDRYEMYQVHLQGQAIVRQRELQLLRAEAAEREESDDG
jgi:hypothetical protein